MNAEQLDDRIRTMVSAAAESAPQPIPFEDIGVPTVRPVASAPSRRRWTATAALVGAAAAVAVGVFVMRSAHDDAPVVVPATEVGSTTPATVDSSVPATTVRTPASYPLVTATADGVLWYSATRCVTSTGCTLAADGTWIASEVAVQWTRLGADRALMAPDGSLIVSLLYTDSPNVSDYYAPMRIATPGATPRPISTQLPRGHYRLHDVARVNGRTVVLVEWTDPTPDDPQNGVYHTSKLLTVDLADGSVVTLVDQFIGFEEASSLLHLTADGVVVGERLAGVDHSLLVIAPKPLQGFTAQDLGLQTSYSECSWNCPRNFSIDRSGTLVGWIDSGSLHVKPLPGATGTARTIALPWLNELFQVTDLQLKGTVAVITGHQSKSEEMSSYLVSLETGTSVAVGRGAATLGG